MFRTVRAERTVKGRVLIPPDQGRIKELRALITKAEESRAKAYDADEFTKAAEIDAQLEQLRIELEKTLVQKVGEEGSVPVREYDKHVLAGPLSVFLLKLLKWGLIIGLVMGALWMLYTLSNRMRVSVPPASSQPSQPATFSRPSTFPVPSSQRNEILPVAPQMSLEEILKDPRACQAYFASRQENYEGKCPDR